MSSDVVLSFDTSNYTTSVAAVDLNGSIVADERILLDVNKGERGLRQSQALFQHIINLPGLVEKVTGIIHDKSCRIAAVAASSRPRPVEGSYMPVFLAGMNTGSAIASSLGVPFYTFSHQEGHIAAVCGIVPEEREYLSFHLSGGTGEIVRVKGNMPLEIAGGIKDISFGQLIDRTGVALGMKFPAGAEMDRLALSGREMIEKRFSRKGRLVIENGCLGPVHVEGCYANLSGIETQCAGIAESLRGAAGCESEDVNMKKFASELFYRISESLVELTINTCRASGLDSIVFAGGVSASSFLRNELAERLSAEGIKTGFGDPALSSDNSCGTGILGANKLNKCRCRM